MKLFQLDEIYHVINYMTNYIIIRFHDIRIIFLLRCKFQQVYRYLKLWY